jgi:hypothetical protein
MWSRCALRARAPATHNPCDMHHIGLIRDAPFRDLAQVAFDSSSLCNWSKPNIAFPWQPAVWWPINTYPAGPSRPPGLHDPAYLG